ncbi:MAG: hypothetical protein ACLRMZ_13580 [Blautia marasmi]
MKWKIGDTCYFVENNYKIIQATVTAVHGDFCVVKYGPNAGIRLRASRLYQTPEEAHNSGSIITRTTATLISMTIRR